jgi:hypothetical protein
MNSFDEALVDVRESAEIDDWCVVCGDAKCTCQSRGYSNTEMVSVRAILERIDDDARTIEQLTRSVHMVKDAEIAELHRRIDALSKPCGGAFYADEESEDIVLCPNGMGCGLHHEPSEELPEVECGE